LIIKKKEEGRRKKEEGRRKKEEGRITNQRYVVALQRSGSPGFMVDTVLGTTVRDSAILSE
jgi:hypothetical protein